MALVVGEAAGLEPLAEALSKEGVREILAPEGAVGDAGLGQGAVEIQHADQAGPGAAPIGDGEDGAAMGVKPGQDVMAVLPDGFGHDQRGAGIEFAEDFHAHLLGIDEAVLFGRVKGMGADAGPAFGFEGLGEEGLHFGLDGPAFLVGGQAQVAAGHEVNVSGGQGFGLHVRIAFIAGRVRG